MAPPLSLFIHGNEPVLADLIGELTAASASMRQTPVLQVCETATAADIALVSAASEKDINDARMLAGKWREAAPGQVRLLLLSAGLPDQDDDALDGLFSGIFKKPVRLAVLLDHAVNAHRLARLKTPRQLNAAVALNPFTRAIEDKEKGISEILSAREAAFLLAVLDAGATGLSRAAAITDVWGYHRDVDSHAVETALYRLRQKLQPFFDGAEMLTSVDGVYRWKGTP